MSDSSIETTKVFVPHEHSPASGISDLSAAVAACQQAVIASGVLATPIGVGEVAAWSRILRAEIDPATAASAVALIALARKLRGVAFTNADKFPLAQLARAAAPLIDDWRLPGLREQLSRSPESTGDVLEKLIPQACRHPSGLFLTSQPVARLMARFVDSPKGGSVFDPAVGTGALLLPILRSSRFFGLDINPVCVELARTSLWLQGKESHIALGDALQRGHLDDPDWPLERRTFSAVICNPPYVRHHFYSVGDKKSLTRFYAAHLGVELSGLSTSYVYFFVEAFSRLEPGGTMVFITPADWLDVNFGRPLKEFLLQRGHLKLILRFDPEKLAFPGVLTTSCITVVQRQDSLGDRVSFVDASDEDLLDPPSLDEIRGRGNDIGLASLAKLTKWTQGFGTRRRQFARLRRGCSRQLKDIVRVRRGIATGSNDFFTLSDAEVREWGIEPHFLVPVLRSARQLPEGRLRKSDWAGLRDNGQKCWLLWCHSDFHQLAGTNVGRYIRHGESIGACESYIARHRAPWYSVEEVDPPTIICTYMNRSGARLAVNEAGCRVLTVFLNVYLEDKSVDPHALVEFLNSPRGRKLLSHSGRVYGGGLAKLEPTELLSTPIPDDLG